MRQTFAWLLQLVALGVVAAALLIGLVYDALKMEITLLAAGGGMFLLGRALGGRSD